VNLVDSSKDKDESETVYAIIVVVVKKRRGEALKKKPTKNQRQ